MYLWMYNYLPHGLRVLPHMTAEGVGFQSVGTPTQRPTDRGMPLLSTRTQRRRLPLNLLSSLYVHPQQKMGHAPSGPLARVASVLFRGLMAVDCRGPRDYRCLMTNVPFNLRRR